MTEQSLPLIPLMTEERLSRAIEWLRKNGKHTLYCGWDRRTGLYDRALGCTCGLTKILEEEDEA